MCSLSNNRFLAFVTYREIVLVVVRAQVSLQMFFRIEKKNKIINRTRITRKLDVDTNFGSNFFYFDFPYLRRIRLFRPRGLLRFSVTGYNFQNCFLRSVSEDVGFNTGGYAPIKATRKTHCKIIRFQVRQATRK